MNRRRFLKTSFTAAAATAFPNLIPASALGKDGAVAPSGRITMGFIGYGGRASQVVPVYLDQPDVQGLAVCDVDAKNRAAAKQLVDAHYGNQSCAAYRDLRELLARDDVDAVYIALGDRWHALSSVLALRAGKDVYCEKPISMTMAQAQAVTDAVKLYGRVYQVGIQRRSVGNFAFAVNLARTGRLGWLRTLYAGILALHPSPSLLPPEPEPPREEFDWDLWLGPCPWRPYNKGYVHGWPGWHAFSDFCGGVTEWATHTLDLCQLANHAEMTAPVEYERVGEEVIAVYANSVKVVMRVPGWQGSCGVRFEGDEGWVQTDDSGDVQVHPLALRSQRALTTEEWKRPVAHPRNFLDCIKTRARPIADVETARHTHVACHASNIAVELGRKMRWDAIKEEFVGDEEANRMRSCAMRAPWRV